MSRSPFNAVRNCVGALAACATFIASPIVAPPLLAQDDGGVTNASDDDREVIDILAPIPTAPVDPLDDAECTRDQEAARISGEIIVCAPPRDDSEYRTDPNSSKRYAEETAYANDPQAPDVAGAGIFRGPATVSGLCIIPPCPPPKALIIDVTALPEAPPGSDADRIARGLAPLGDANPVGDGVVGDGVVDSVVQTTTGPVIDYASTLGNSIGEDTASGINPPESAEPEARP